MELTIHTYPWETVKAQALLDENAALRSKVEGLEGELAELEARDRISMDDKTWNAHEDIWQEKHRELEQTIQALTARAEQAEKAMQETAISVRDLLKQRETLRGLLHTAMDLLVELTDDSPGYDASARAELLAVRIEAALALKAEAEKG